jgi:hypothetical protein
MKTLKVLSLCILFSLIFIGCEKDQDINSQSSSSPNESFLSADKNISRYHKATFTDFEDVCKAANIDEFNYNGGTGYYDVSYYDSTSISYEIILNYSSIDSINFDINDGSNDYEMIFDGATETISIQGDDDYTFEEFEGYDIGTSTNRKKNLAIIFVGIQYDSLTYSFSFDDNGTSDTYTPTTTESLRFWWNGETTFGPCDNGWQDTSTRWERFWIFKGNFSNSVPC